MHIDATNDKPESRDIEISIPKARNSTKARIRVEHRDGKHFLIKDYSTINPLIRFSYGRFTLRREAKAYSKLSGVSGFPHCYGLEGKDVLVLQYIDGRPLSSFKRGKVPAAVFEKLDQLISSMHSRGVANCDLHRSNIILTDTCDVYMVDFASALISIKPGSPGFMIRLMKQLDLHAAANIRARYLRQSKPAPKGFFGFLYTVIKFFKSLLGKIKK